jgi:hypothetical protein
MRFAFVFLVSSLVAACGGKEFLRPQSETIILGSTTYSEVIGIHGEPHKLVTVTLSDLPVRIATYSYAKATPFTTRLSNKEMVLIFDKGVLTSYDYVSSFEEDKSLIALDDDKIR